MIPEFYRKSNVHRALWATMKTLAQYDDIGLVSKLSVPRAAVTTAMDRRLTILEHEASEKLKAYFQIERRRIVGAIKLHGAAGVDDMLDRLRPELRSVLDSIYQTAAQDWGRWTLRSMPEVKKKYSDDEPRDERGRWSIEVGTHIITREVDGETRYYAGGGHEKPGAVVMSSPQWIRELQYAKTFPSKEKADARIERFQARGDMRQPHNASYGAEVHPHPDAVKKAKDDEPKRRPIAGPIGVGDLEVPIDTWLAENIGKKIRDVTDSSRKMIASQIRSGMKEGESLGQIARRLDNFYLDEIIPNRSMVIARTETGTITNWIQNLIARDTQSQGVTLEKEWASLRDTRTRPTHREADGQRVALDEPFQVGEALLMFPLDPSGPPEEVIECRCGVLYHVVDEEKAAFAKFERFAKSVSGIDSYDVAVALGYASGIFAEGDDWITARKRLAKRMHQIRRTGWTDEARAAALEARRANAAHSTEGVESHPDYLYHATNEERADQIAEEGFLKPHGPSYGTDQDSWPDGAREKRSYWSPNLQTTESFAPEEGKPVFFRVRHANHPFKRESTGDHYSTKPVSAHRIEYLAQDKTWQPLRTTDDVTKAGPPDEPRDEQGRWTPGGGNEGAVREPTESVHHTEHMPEAQAAAVRKFEDELRARNTGKRGVKERMVILAPDGSVIIDKEGKHRSVGFMGSEVRKVSAAGGAVLTHNHPDDGGYSLSPNDVAAVYQMDAVEVRAVGRDYTYSLRPKPGKKWPNPLVMNTMYDHTQRPMIDESRKRGDETLGRMEDVDRHDPKAVKKYNTEATAYQQVENLRMQHETWMRIANKLNLQYTRIKTRKS